MMINLNLYFNIILYIYSIIIMRLVRYFTYLQNIINNYLQDSETVEGIPQSQIGQNEFIGQWQSSSTQFNVLDSRGNEIVLSFDQYAFQYNTANMYFEVKNTPYYENEYVSFNITSTDYNEQESTWEGLTELNYTTFNQFRKQNSYTECQVYYKIKATQQENLHFLLDVSMQLQPESPSYCGNIDFTASMHIDETNFNLKVLFFGLYITCISGIKLYSSVRFLNLLKTNIMLISKLSSISLFFSIIQTFFHFSQDFELGVQNYFFFFPTILELIILNSQAMILSIIFRQPGHFLHNDPFWKSFFKFIMLIEISWLVYVFLNYQYGTNNWFILCTGFILVPQIIHNIRKANREFFGFYYIGLLSSDIFYYVGECI